jgi:hypothetical protein
MQPINYLTQVADPFAEATQGLKLGVGMAELQQKQELMVQQQQQQQLAAQEQARFLAKPNPTMRDALQFASVLPKDRADALRPYIENFSKEQQQGVLKTNGQILSALQVNPKTGIKLMRDYAAGQRNNGDEAEASLYERIADAAEDQERGPGMAFKALVTVTARIPGAKEMFETIDKASTTAKVEAEAPAELRKKLADADKAEADAVSAQEKAITAEEVEAADLQLKKAQAKSAQIKSEYAQTNEILDVQTKGRQLNLTDAQIQQALAAIRASDAAAKKSGADATLAQRQANEIAAGIIPVDKRPEAEAKFRKEYSDQTKGYQDVKSAYGRILAVSDPKTPDEEAPADLALVFNFMKMQDPGSTVNSGEFANAQNAAGVPDRIKNLYNNLITGGRLNPTQRKAFRGQAENLFKVSGQQEDTVRKGIGRIAKGYGLNTENIFYTSTEVAPTALNAPSGNSVTVNGKTYTRPANFTDAQWGAYKQSMGVQ